jgi:hypothetical protein
MLHNPAYAGAYVYGRTQTRTTPLPGEAPRVKGRTRAVASDAWAVVIPDAHPGYISWEQFQRNQARLADNRTYRPEEHRGAVREGAALLQGIVLCGRCGRRMGVRYLPDGVTPSYECNELHTQLAAPTCQTIRGDGVDAAVARVFLEAMQPAQLAVSLATLEQVEEQARQVERQWQLRRERAQYEADLARRRFLAVEPENRLVARSLEREWNDKLAALAELEREYTALTPQRPAALSAAERERILALAQDVPALWQARTTTPAERKQLIRFLIKDVTLRREERTIQIAIRWQTEARTELAIPRPQRAWEACRTDPVVIARVRELAPTHTDRQIAALLASEGLRGGRGGALTTASVQWVRYAHQIPLQCPAQPAVTASGQRADGRYSAAAAAALLNVTVSTICEWCKTGRLDAVQDGPHGEWWIHLTAERMTALCKPQRRQWQRRTAKEAKPGA